MDMQKEKDSGGKGRKRTKARRTARKGEEKK